MAGYQDVLISSIGDFGRGQLLIALVCILLKFTGPWFLFTVGYISYEPDWWKVKRVFNGSKYFAIIFNPCKMVFLKQLLFDLVPYNLLNCSLRE